MSLFFFCFFSLHGGYVTKYHYLMLFKVQDTSYHVLILIQTLKLLNVKDDVINIAFLVVGFIYKVTFETDLVLYINT